MSAGGRDTLIRFFRAGEPIDDGYTSLPGGEAEVGALKAEVFYGSGMEQRQMASQEGAVQAVTFRVPASTISRSVVVTDTIRDRDGNNWDIEAIAYRGRRLIEFTTKRAL